MSLKGQNTEGRGAGGERQAREERNKQRQKHKASGDLGESRIPGDSAGVAGGSVAFR